MTGDPIRLLCNFLGRRNFASRFLDWVSGWIVPAARPAVFAGHGPVGPAGPYGWSRGDGLTGAEPLWMGEGPGTEGGAPLAPLKPHDHHRGENPPFAGEPLRQFSPEEAQSRFEKRMEFRKHVEAACAEVQYRGLHGRPCKFVEGSDNKCPKGTLSGWFWKYQTPVGVVYYVDCCGKEVSTGVWCNWTNEKNWCVSAGDNAGLAARNGKVRYTCTLAILDKDMKTRDVGGRSRTLLEVVGADAD